MEEHLVKSFDDQTTSDVEVVLEETPGSDALQVLHLHRIILARCDYFRKALFSSSFVEGRGCSERREGRLFLPLDNIPLRVYVEFFRCLYVPVVEDRLHELWNRSECGSCSDNFLYLHYLADRFGFTELEHACCLLIVDSIDNMSILSTINYCTEIVPNKEIMRACMQWLKVFCFHSRSLCDKAEMIPEEWRKKLCQLDDVITYGQKRDAELNPITATETAIVPHSPLAKVSQSRELLIVLDSTDDITAKGKNICQFDNIARASWSFRLCNSGLSGCKPYLMVSAWPSYAQPCFQPMSSLSSFHGAPAASCSQVVQETRVFRVQFAVIGRRKTSLTRYEGAITLNSMAVTLTDCVDDLHSCFFRLDDCRKFLLAVILRITVIDRHSV